MNKKIREQVQYLRWLQYEEDFIHVDSDELCKTFKEAADTIEMLSNKLDELDYQESCTKEELEEIRTKKDCELLTMILGFLAKNPILQEHGFFLQRRK